MPDQDQSISSDRLTDVLGLLGAGGLAKAGIGAATKGVLLTAPQFQRLRELNPNQAMHPAVAESTGWKGNLAHPDAVAEQRNLDDYIYQNYDRMSRPLIGRDVEHLHSNYGWQVGPQQGFGREASDVGASLSHSNFPSLRGKEYFGLVHPSGNPDSKSQGSLQSVLGMNAGVYEPGLMYLYGTPAGYDPLVKRIKLDPAMKDPYLSTPYLGKFGGANYPHEKSLMPLVMHEAQHAAQGGKPYIPDIPHSLQPSEWESRAVEHSLLHPEAYYIPFMNRAMPENYDYNNFLRMLRGR